MIDGKVKNISASRGAAILGLSQYDTPFTSWLKFMLEQDPEFCTNRNIKQPEPVEYNNFMKVGHLFEEPIMHVVAGFGNTPYDIEKFYERDFMTCHIDCRIDGVINEIKTVYQRAFYKWGKPETDRVPSNYQIQCQHQMMLSGDLEMKLRALVLPVTADKFAELEGWIEDADRETIESVSKNMMHNGFLEMVLVLNRLGFLHTYNLKANDQLQDLMLERYSTFWNDYVLPKEPPPVQTFEDIKSLVIDPCGVVVLDAEHESLVSEYNDIKKEIGAKGSLAARANQIKFLIMEKALEALPHMTEELKNESREKIAFLNEQGKKIKGYSLKGGFR